MKNAYLIIAHSNYDLLLRLVQQLDSEDNDIFIHINSLVEAPNVEKVKGLGKHSKIVFTNRKEIVWGLYGVVEAIYELLRTSRGYGSYDYYHLISGVDVPIKSNHYINKFLEDHVYANTSNGKYKTNYIICHTPFDRTEYFPVCQYNCFVRCWRNENPIIRKMAKGSALCLNYLQSFVGINRLGDIRAYLYKGDAFWSITEEMADYFLAKEVWARGNFNKYTFAPEEYIFPTLARNSELSESIYVPENDQERANLRCIDFERGKPYTWRICDYDELLLSEALFARKFDPQVDTEIIDLLYKYITEFHWQE